MENEKLKPCPFCGGTAYVTNDYGSSSSVKCNNPICGAAVRLWVNPEKAIAAWNRRADDWLPMESAPVTGWRGLIDVLVWSPQLGIKTGRLCRVSADDRPSVDVAAYHGDAVANWGVTRWRPLPSPPEEK